VPAPRHLHMSASGPKGADSFVARKLSAFSGEDSMLLYATRTMSAIDQKRNLYSWFLSEANSA
jgi:hypothetical protein